MRLFILFILILPFFSNAQEPSPDSTPEILASSESSQPNLFRWGAGVFYQAGKDLMVSGMTNNISSFDVERSWGVLGSFQYMPFHNWGFLSTLNIENTRRIISTVTPFSMTPAFDGKNDKIRIVNLTANAIYRWGSFYIPFGINLSHVSYSADGSGAHVQTHAGWGTQGGIGWIFDRNWSFDLMSKTMSFSFDQDSGGTSTRYDIRMSGIFADVRYVF